MAHLKKFLKREGIEVRKEKDSEVKKFLTENGITEDSYIKVGKDSYRTQCSGYGYAFSGKELIAYYKREYGL